VVYKNTKLLHFTLLVRPSTHFYIVSKVVQQWNILHSNSDQVSNHKPKNQPERITFTEITFQAC